MGDDLSVEMISYPSVLVSTIEVCLRCPDNAAGHIGRVIAASEVAVVQVLDDVGLPTSPCGDRDATARQALEQGVAKRLVARGAEHDMRLAEHGVDVSDIAQISVTHFQLLQQRGVAQIAVKQKVQPVG